MKAVIYLPSRNAMQSGPANTQGWRLTFQAPEPLHVDPLMGWVGSADTVRQVELNFETREDAIAYAERHGLPYVLMRPKLRRSKPKSYADNFRFAKPA